MKVQQKKFIKKSPTLYKALNEITTTHWPIIRLVFTHMIGWEFLNPTRVRKKKKKVQPALLGSNKHGFWLVVPKQLLDYCYHL